VTDELQSGKDLEGVVQAYDAKKSHKELQLVWVVSWL